MNSDISTPPNISRRIISEDCKDCGKCCEVFEIWYPPADFPTKTPAEKFELMLKRSELVRILLLSGSEDIFSVREDVDGGVWLCFNRPCRHLLPDKSCAIYESPDRPLICRAFPYPNSTETDCPKIRGRRTE